MAKKKTTAKKVTKKASAKKAPAKKSAAKKVAKKAAKKAPAKKAAKKAPAKKAAKKAPAKKAAKKAPAKKEATKKTLAPETKASKKPKNRIDTPEIREKIRELIKLAKEQEYLTYDDIHEILPNNLIEEEDIKAILERLRQMEFEIIDASEVDRFKDCLLYTSPSPRDS